MPISYLTVEEPFQLPPTLFYTHPNNLIRHSITWKKPQRHTPMIHDDDLLLIYARLYSLVSKKPRKLLINKPTDSSMAGASSSMVLAAQVSWYCTLLLALMLALSCCDPSDVVLLDHQEAPLYGQAGPEFYDTRSRRCDEIYVVGEGETLQTIGEKCGDPYIVEENPHIHDPDDVFPGLVIKITPLNKR
ncbi:hypothetical protein SAY86_030459 [Trapa natans]|uniref:LysM domain-containing protein n=1 Tax=Trapa natans TaxID=22666 RepID=A0AAN7LXZ5_TRANT|nr:hypothetical protein SAY86_030459 [Trapa natans]